MNILKFAARDYVLLFVMLAAANGMVAGYQKRGSKCTNNKPYETSALKLVT